MKPKRRKTVEIPDRPDEPAEAQWYFEGDEPDLRDVSKPVALDEQGRPLYAPRGIVVRWP